MLFLIDWVAPCWTLRVISLFLYQSTIPSNFQMKLTLYQNLYIPDPKSQNFAFCFVLRVPKSGKRAWPISKVGDDSLILKYCEYSFEHEPGLKDTLCALLGCW